MNNESMIPTEFVREEGYSPPWVKWLEDNKEKMKLTPARIKKLTKGFEAIDMRAGGFNMKDIKKAVNWTGTVQTLTALMMECLRTYGERSIENTRKDVYARYEMMWAGLEKRAYSGDARSIESGCRILSEIRELLGLDSPKTLTVSNNLNPMEAFTLSLGGSTIRPAIDTTATPGEEIS